MRDHHTSHPDGLMVHTVAMMITLLWGAALGLSIWDSARAEGDTIAFAVVSEPPKNKMRISVKLTIEGSVIDTVLLPSDHILSNPIWRQLEICHALKLEGQQSAEGFRLFSVRAIDGAMLPMTLQGIEGDCLLKKALEVAPLVD